ncbi:HAD family phosphatase [Tessaracoccus sp. ZS01]|nr:HAD family phosphatase [Tessaracoccus sp. ZS01]MCG6568530.1 HAD family phosphatase [Tessaracoccus sp. ZS01]
MSATTTTGKRLPQRVAAVLFDMDNTLVASEDAWFAATRKLWEEVGGDATGKGVLGGTVSDVVDDFLREYPDADRTELSERMTNLIMANLAGGVRPTPGALALIERLSATMPITIASNSPTAIVEHVVSALGWGDLFTAALGTEDVERPKPAPDLYLAAAARCGVSIEDCVVFEDSPMGATAARASGAFVVTIGPETRHLGDVNVPDLTDPRITAWEPEVRS